MALANALVAILVAWLWASFAAPPIARGFGVPMISGWRLDKRNRHLSKPDYVWGCGVFAVGSGLFLFLLLKRSLYCKLITNSFPHWNAPTLALTLVLGLAGGWLFGVLTAPQREMSDFPIR